jgi:hypothetical protein
VRPKCASILLIVISALTAGHSQAEEGPVWFWFESCGSKPLTFQVLVEEKPVLERIIDICRRGRWDRDPGAQKHLTIAFTSSRDMSWEDYLEGLKSSAGTRFELDMWQAGAEPDALTIGVTVTSSKQIYTHFYHFAEPNRIVTSEIAPGIVVRTSPVHKPAGTRVEPPNKSLERTREG